MTNTSYFLSQDWPAYTTLSHTMSHQDDKDQDQDQATPQTNKNVWSDSSEGIMQDVVSASFARRLEIELNKAKEEIRLLKAIMDMMKDNANE